MNFEAHKYRNQYVKGEDDYLQCSKQYQVIVADRKNMT